MTFNSSPLIFICRNPILTILTSNQLYLISVSLHMFYKNTASKFLNFAYHLGHFHMAVVPIEYIGLGMIIRMRSSDL